MEEYVVRKKNKRNKIQERKVIIDGESMILRTKTMKNKLKREISIHYLREINMVSSDGFPYVVKIRWQKKAPTDHPLYFLVFADEDSQKRFARSLFQLRITYTGFPPKGNVGQKLERDPDEKVSTSSVPEDHSEPTAEAKELSQTPMVDASDATEPPTKKVEVSQAESMDAGDDADATGSVAKEVPFQQGPVSGNDSEDSSDDEDDDDSDRNSAENSVLAFIVIGASDPVAIKKIYPTLWSMFRKRLIPRESLFVGFARAKLKNKEFHSRIQAALVEADAEAAAPTGGDGTGTADQGGMTETKSHSEEDEQQQQVARVEEENALRDQFLRNCQYIFGESFDDIAALKKLKAYVDTSVLAKAKRFSNKVVFFPLEHSVWKNAATQLSAVFGVDSGWTRIVLDVEEKGGFSQVPEEDLNLHGMFRENQIFRVSKYMDNELLQKMLILRFANRVLYPLWNSSHVKNITITLKKSKQHDEHYFLRNSLQTHLLQLLSFFCMECPLTNEAWAIQASKIKLLKSIMPASINDTVFGSHLGEDAEPTFVSTVLRVKTDRWDGVPIILRCGEATNEDKHEIRVQFRENCGEIFDGTQNNELVVRISPNEAMYLKMQIKEPGVTFNSLQSYLDLSYSTKMPLVGCAPCRSEQLVLDVLREQSTCFLLSDEFKEATRIFEPLFSAEDYHVHAYEQGSRGPVASDELAQRVGFTYSPSSK